MKPRCLSDDLGMDETGERPDTLDDGRHLPPGLPIVVVQAAIDVVATYYDKAWLGDERKTHPIRTIWQSKDVISTQELYWLGDSIQLISKVNSGWLRDAIAKTKLFDISRAGTMFEIIMIAALLRGGQEAEPSPPNAPKIDAIFTTFNGQSVAVSMKSFGATSREKEFLRESTTISKAVRGVMTRRRLHWLGFLATAEEYPRPVDWTQLPPIVEDLSLRGLSEKRNGVWTVCPLRWHRGNGSLSANFQSYSHVIVSPHHENESKTFADNIAAAAKDLDEYASGLHDSSFSVLFVRISENADMTQQLTSAKAYLLSGTSRIDGIMFLQMSVAVQSTMNTTSILISACSVWKDGIPPAPMTFRFASGLCSETPPQYEIEREGKSMRLGPGHVFADTNIFPETTVELRNLKDGVTANGEFLPGYTINMVLAFDKENHVAISPRHRLPTRLSLFA